MTTFVIEDCATLCCIVTEHIICWSNGFGWRNRQKEKNIGYQTQTVTKEEEGKVVCRMILVMITNTNIFVFLYDNSYQDISSPIRLQRQRQQKVTKMWMTIASQMATILKAHLMKRWLLVSCKSISDRCWCSWVKQLAWNIINVGKYTWQCNFVVRVQLVTLKKLYVIVYV